MVSNIQTSVKVDISTLPRHPKDNEGYDGQNHCYRPEYVQPASWQLYLAAQLPADCERCEWHITQEDGAFDQTFSQGADGSPSGKITVAVPAPGEYKVQLTAQTKNGRHTEEKHFTLRDYLVVAIGDSYFCGEGNPDIPGEPSPVLGPIACNLATFTKFLKEKVGVDVPMAQPAVWQEKLVHRSYKAGVSLAASSLEDTQQGTVITYLNFARSGASIEKGFINPRDQDDWTELGQLEEMRRAIGDRPIDALLISVGGNDIQFSDRLLDLLRDDLPVVGDGGILGDDALNRRLELEEAMDLLKELPGELDRLAEMVAEFEPNRVFLTSYPLAQFDKIEGNGQIVTRSGCGIFDGPDMDIDKRDAELIKATGRKLNRTLYEAANKYDWYFIDGIPEGFAGHGICSDDPYFRSAEESCKMQGDFKGTLHPNEKGVRVYAELIEAALREHLLSG